MKKLLNKKILIPALILVVLILTATFTVAYFQEKKQHNEKISQIKNQLEKQQSEVDDLKKNEDIEQLKEENQELKAKLKEQEQNNKNNEEPSPSVAEINAQRKKQRDACINEAKEKYGEMFEEVKDREPVNMDSTPEAMIENLNDFNEEREDDFDEIKEDFKDAKDYCYKEYPVK